MDFKLEASQHAQALLTLETAWAAFFPRHPIVEGKFLRMWLHYNPLSTVIAAFEFAAQENYYTDARHLGRIITLLLKNVRYE